MYYNFCRVHKSLRVTPAMEAGITDHVWSIEELAVFVARAGVWGSAGLIARIQMSHYRLCRSLAPRRFRAKVPEWQFPLL